MTNPTTLCLALILICAGCDSGGGGSSSLSQSAASSSEGSSGAAGSSGSAAASAPKIQGTWTGVYVVYGGTNAQDGQGLTANVQQDGDAVAITTTLPAAGRFLTGSIKPNGDMRLTDALDGELWTTHFGPATANSMRIADFLMPPSAAMPNPPIAVLELSR